MVFKSILTTLCIGTAGIAMADPTGILAEGSVTYRHPNGNLVDRDCTLWVPARGVGEVVLNCGGVAVPTADFETFHDAKGKTVFTVTFKNAPGAPEGTVARFRGTYLRGENRAIYYGDVFSGVKNSNSTTDGHLVWNYVGGFKFSKDVE